MPEFPDICEIGLHSLSSDAVAQLQPTGSQAPTKPGSSQSPPSIENRRDGGCWLKRVGLGRLCLLRISFSIPDFISTFSPYAQSSGGALAAAKAG